MPYYIDAIIAHGVLLQITGDMIEFIEIELCELLKDFMDIVINYSENENDDELFIYIKEKYLPVNNNVPVSVYDKGKFRLTESERDALEMIAIAYDGSSYLDRELYVFYSPAEPRLYFSSSTTSCHQQARGCNIFLTHIMFK